ncbi:MAG: hypothetical protein CSA09_04695 [Candidatus Contendobacter odensis]|uniref:Nitrogen fixation protein FixH n=1 Tax=Candidatus Contendibacter odensensis TaxID=1400860 RepID=A0A2G6PEC1_9GAMM|nr:MAG: hypothetical protein CSA09_04695 [Candidatus Contendobacter odensis]
MNGLLFSLALGTALIVLANVVLVRFIHVSAKQAAAVMVLVILGLYVPYAILFWPGGDVFAIHLAIYLMASFVCAILLGARVEGQRLCWEPVAISGFFIFVVMSGAVFIAVAEHGLPPSVRDWLLPDKAGQRGIMSSFPGVVSHDYHKKESLYNQYLKQVERQRQRGWRVRKGWVHSAPRVNEATPFRVAVETRDAVPVTGARVTGMFLRPSSNKLDVGFDLPEIAPGIYEASIALSVVGHWDLVLQIRKDEELHEIRARTRVLAHRRL